MHVSLTVSSQTVITESGITFGTSGARGLMSDFTDDVCDAFANAFIQAIRTRFTFTTIAFAIDNRPSSPPMAAACIAAAMWCFGKMQQIMAFSAIFFLIDLSIHITVC